MFVARDVRVGGLRLGHSTAEAGEQWGVATSAESVEGRTGANGRKGIRNTYWTLRQVSVSHEAPPDHAGERGAACAVRVHSDV